MKNEMHKDLIVTPEILDELLAASVPLDPGPDRTRRMLDRIKSRIQVEPNLMPDTLTVEYQGGEWTDFVEGGQIKLLREEADTWSFLLRLEPGTRFPAHLHHGDEECLVLEGQVCFGDIELNVGDYHLARKGSEHGEVFSKSGCLLFLRGATQQYA